MHLKSKRGDTLIEVVLAFAMFSLVATISIAAMSGSISGAEAAIELTLARTEIDSQSETLRFIQGSFARDRAYGNLWSAITSRALTGGDATNNLPSLSVDNCEALYQSTSTPNIYTANAFVLNSRKVVDSPEPTNNEYYGKTLITADDYDTDKDTFLTSSLNPRIIYTTDAIEPDTTDDNLNEVELYDIIDSAEGIYDAVVADSDHPTPYFYDFHIYTCWFPPGANRPSTIGTVVRLYNPEFSNGI